MAFMDCWKVRPRRAAWICTADAGKWMRSACGNVCAVCHAFGRADLERREASHHQRASRKQRDFATASRSSGTKQRRETAIRSSRRHGIGGSRKAPPDHPSGPARTAFDPGQPGARRAGLSLPYADRAAASQAPRRRYALYPGCELLLLLNSPLRAPRPHAAEPAFFGGTHARLPRASPKRLEKPKRNRKAWLEYLVGQRPAAIIPGRLTPGLTPVLTPIMSATADHPPMQ